MQIEGKRGPGRPRMTWKTLTERDFHEWNLNEVDPSPAKFRSTNWRCSRTVLEHLELF